MLPSTGSDTWDTILQIAIALTLLVSLVLLARDYLRRR
jgi:LPXTG-motif cell wall-anchored protein